MDEILETLTMSAQQHHVGTKERGVALSKLIAEIYRSPKLYRPTRGFPPAMEQEIYQEALQNLFLWLCENINQYNRERGKVITWINMLINRRFYPEATCRIVGSKNEVQMDSSDLENISQESLEDEDSTRFETIREYIQNDPERILAQTKMRSHPHINLQKIALKKISGVSWKEMSLEWNIPIPTLSNFYQRNLQKLRERMQELF